MCCTAVRVRRGSDWLEARNTEDSLQSEAVAVDKLVDHMCRSCIQNLTAPPDIPANSRRNMAGRYESLSHTNPPLHSLASVVLAAQATEPEDSEVGVGSSIRWLLTSLGP
eukprot:3712074-Rhodomonas_salina.1